MSPSAVHVDYGSSYQAALDSQPWRDGDVDHATEIQTTTSDQLWPSFDCTQIRVPGRSIARHLPVPLPLPPNRRVITYFTALRHAHKHSVPHSTLPASCLPTAIAGRSLHLRSRPMTLSRCDSSHTTSVASLPACRKPTSIHSCLPACRASSRYETVHSGPQRHHTRQMQVVSNSAGSTKAQEPDIRDVPP